MNTQAFSHAFGALGSQAQPKWDAAGAGLSFQDFPASQDNFLEFADFSQVLVMRMMLIGLQEAAAVAAGVQHADRGVLQPRSPVCLSTAHDDDGPGPCWMLLFCRVMDSLVLRTCLLASNRCVDLCHGSGQLQQLCVCSCMRLQKHSKKRTCSVSCQQRHELLVLLCAVLQLKFDENFDDILDEESSTRTPAEQLPEWACA